MPYRPPPPPERRCQAHFRKGERAGEQCTQYAMVGQKVCHKHGGAAKHAREAGQRRFKQQKLAVKMAALGLPREVDPATALLEEVWRSAGHVAWLGQVVGALQHDAAQLAESRLVDGTEVSVWVRLYNDERDRLAKVSKMALDAGVAQALVDIAHAQSAQLIRYTDALLRALGHDPDAPAVRELVHAQLRLVAAG